MRKYLVKTLGCKANLYDSQQLEADLQAKGWMPATSEEDPGIELCVVNSCTVTDEADKQSRRMARKLGKVHAQAKVVFTGCSAEVDPTEGTHSLEGVHYIVGNRDKARVLDLIGGAPDVGSKPIVLGNATGYEQMLSRHPMDREWPLPEEVFGNPKTLAMSARTRAFLKIQEGCNSFCTYCVIPYGRGPSRSLSQSDVIRQIQFLVDQGVREVILTGTNLGDYGMEWAPKNQGFETLLEAIFLETSLERLRVSSLDPTEITPKLIELMRREPRFCPHFHVSLQSIHTGTLKRMKRNYDSEKAQASLQAIATIPGVFVGMDVITGFPGESEEDFEWSLKALERLPWSRLHVFPYSERSGTPATRLPYSVEPSERKRRSRVLNDLSLRRLQERAEKLKAATSTLEEILIEGPCRGPDGTEGWVGGYTRNYLRTVLRAAGLKSNQTVNARLQGQVVDRAAGDVVFIGETL